MTSSPPAPGASSPVHATDVSARSTAITAPDDGVFSHDGGPIGVVLSHGFTGTPASMRQWAEQLAAAGYTVRVPLLPGHGATWQEMNRTTWPQWYGAVEAEFQQLRARCEQVFAFGLSMGGTLVTRLAEQYRDDVAGLVLVNPSYGTMRRDVHLARFLAPIIASRPGIGSDIKADRPGGEGGYGRTPLRAFVSLQKLWRVVVADLPSLRAPILLYTSRVDHVVDPLSARLLHAGATGSSITQHWLENSYHVATVDNDAQQIFDGSLEFLRAYQPAGA